MQGDDSIRIDQDISAPLGDIPFRLFQSLPLQDLFQLHPPGFRTPYVPKGSGEHPIGPVRFAGIVHEKGPGQRSILDIHSGEEVVFERDHCDSNLPPAKLLFPITQLRDVRPARESAEVAMKHHQQPTSTVLLKAVTLAGTVPKSEGDGGLSGEVNHGESPRAYVPPWTRNVASNEYPL
jgi:hypothetical protein